MYAYRGLDKDGLGVENTIEAGSWQSAAEKLAQAGISTNQSNCKKVRAAQYKLDMDLAPSLEHMHGLIQKTLNSYLNDRQLMSEILKSKKGMTTRTISLGILDQDRWKIQRWFKPSAPETTESALELVIGLQDGYMLAIGAVVPDAYNMLKSKRREIWNEIVPYYKGAAQKVADTMETHKI